MRLREERFSVLSEPDLDLTTRFGHTKYVDTFVGVEVTVGIRHTVNVAEGTVGQLGERVFGFDADREQRRAYANDAQDDQHGSGLYTFDDINVSHRYTMF